MDNQWAVHVTCPTLYITSMTIILILVQFMQLPFLFMIQLGR